MYGYVFIGQYGYGYGMMVYGYKYVYVYVCAFMPSNVYVYMCMVWLLLGSVLDGEGDVWSLGCVLYTLLYSQSPFE
ncbi:hypothetical protein EON63_24425, partial [archaeon]